MRRQTVGILIFEDVEVLDSCGPFEVFVEEGNPESNARRVSF